MLDRFSHSNAIERESSEDSRSSGGVEIVSRQSRSTLDSTSDDSSGKETVLDAAQDQGEDVSRVVLREEDLLSTTFLVRAFSITKLESVPSSFLARQGKHCSYFTRT